LINRLLGDKAKNDVFLARYTSARIGGPADFLVAAGSADELAEMVRKLWASGVKFMILGGGSNVLVADAGFRGAVVLNRARTVRIEGQKEEARVLAESGANLGTVARRCADRGYQGLEWAATVPGTVGGAVVGNAGAYGGDMVRDLRMAEILQRDGKRKWLPVQELHYQYRSSRLKREPGQAVVLAGEFGPRKGSRPAAQAALEEFVGHRKRTQPPGASIGSMFKNPPGDYAGRLIEAAGLKGLRSGNAEISPVHANFFVNLGGAAAADVLRLIRQAQARVAEMFGVNLELEVELVGEWEET